MSLLACFVGSCLLGCWDTFLAQALQQEVANARVCTAPQQGGDCLHRKKEMCFPCRSSAMGKIFVCTSSFWCHIARDKRSLWGSQRMEMGFEGMQWPSQELTQSAPGITVWRTGRLCWSRELYLPAPCRDKCTILHQIRSC